MSRRRVLPFALALPALVLLACEDGTTGGQCRENRECELPLSCIEGVCQIECRIDRDCARGAICFENACYAPVTSCTLDQECRPFGQECDPVIGACVPMGAASCHPTLNPCQGGAPCVEGRCVLPTQDARPGQPAWDGGAPRPDTGAPPRDAQAGPDLDRGAPTPDMRPPTPDMRPPAPDMRPPTPDAALPPGDRGYGEPCDCASQCQSGLCVQNPYAGENARGVCTQQCQPNQGCPGTDRCITAQVPPGKQGCPDVDNGLMEGDQVNVCVFNETGLPCRDANDCVIEGTCVTPPAQTITLTYGSCASGCDNDGNCPPGFVCGEVATDQGGRLRRCIAGTPEIIQCPGDANACGVQFCALRPGEDVAAVTHCLGNPDVPNQGICSCACSSADDCPTGFMCARGLFDTGLQNRPGICLPLAGYTCPNGNADYCGAFSCAADSDDELFDRCTGPCAGDPDCPNGYICDPVDGQGGFCLPAL